MSPPHLDGVANQKAEAGLGGDVAVAATGPSGRTGAESDMTRGNQRELARSKNMKKQTGSSKGKRRDDGLSAAARKQRDSEIMQQKQKAAATSEKKEPPQPK